MREDKLKLYACFSIYNLLITLIKILPTKEKIDLLVGSQMPNYNVLLSRVKNLDCINQIYVFDSVSYKKISYKGKWDKLLYARRKEIQYIENQLDIDWHKYKEEIYIFNDFEILGFYLVDKHICYHLLEDGLNFFTYFHRYYQLPAKAYKGWQIKVKNYLDILHRPFGSSKYAIDIEVNDLQKLEINTKKVFEVPRKQLFERLNEIQRKTIYEIFCQSSVNSNNIKGKKTVLICTQPLYLDGQLKTMDIQQTVYRDVISQYNAEGYQITIKPHPRDTIDYMQLSKDYNCWVIDRYIPSEILNFNPDISYDLALSITTTAIETLHFVKERRYLGFDFLERYK